MKLLPKEIADAIPALYSQDGLGDDATIFVKFFSIVSDWTWYATEYDPSEKLFFGLVKGFEEEYGYFSLDELESLGIMIERDLYFKPTPVREIKSFYKR